MTALLDVRDLRVRFTTDDGVVRAVDGVSYQVERGKTLGIVGESGSGKTVGTLTIMGLTRSRSTEISGQALFDGQDLLTASDETMRGIRGNDIAMIFQDPLSSLHPFYRVGDQLVEGIQAHRDISKEAARDRAAELLSLVGIPDARGRLQSYPHEFSGGMRQRVMVAMALSNGPRLLIADEPTTALDVTVQAQILDLIRDLQRDLGMAVIVITHDLGVVAQVADEIAVMYAGRIIEHAPADAIFTAPEHPYTWGLLRSIPRLDVPRDVELEPIPGRPPSLIQRPPGCAFHPRCAHAFESCPVVDPALAPAATGLDHQVACLLEPAQRVAGWRAQARGASAVAAVQASAAPAPPEAEPQEGAS
jgi:peptide/nickel transport system ATP-binding protein